ncbi:MAG: hypothetical protein IT379_30270 [Deltaproteobacteria bacterium]|nr:hypothetical protein [Deltaproteobacteria bacterium]
MRTTFELYWSDLTREAQERLLDELGMTSEQDMNWDQDIHPITTIEMENNDEEE